MAPQRIEFGSRPGVENADRAVVAPTDEHGSGVIDRDAGNGRFVIVDRKQVFPGFDAPGLDRGVFAAADKKATITRKRESPNDPVMGFDLPDDTTRLRVAKVTSGLYATQSTSLSRFGRQNTSL
jgi:hypothetical protein